MTATTVYQRILLKLSGEALMGEQGYGIDAAVLQFSSSSTPRLPPWWM